MEVIGRDKPVHKYVRSASEFGSLRRGVGVAVGRQFYCLQTTTSLLYRCLKDGDDQEATHRWAESSLQMANDCDGSVGHVRHLFAELHVV